jgi:mannose-1-phosphate guanylyltransferase/phosphomannomutase
MMPIGKDRKPVLEHVLRLLLRHGLEDVVVVTKPDNEVIQDYFGDGSRFGARMAFHAQPFPAMGSADVVRDAYVNTDIRRYERILTYYGDIVSDLNIGALLRKHSRSKAALTLALSKEYRLQVVVPKMNASGQISRVVAYPELRKVLSGGRSRTIVGVSIAENDTLALLEDLETEGMDFMGGFVPELLRRKKRVTGYVHRGYWVDVGTEENYIVLTHRSVT